MSSEEFRGKPLAGDDSPRWVLGRLVRGTLGRLLLLAFRVRLHGRNNVPQSGAILAGNHVSYLDPAIIWSAIPRPAHFVGKVELWDTGWLGFLLDRFWVIPVKRDSADREMIQTASALLAAGDLLGMFPEGTRKRDLSSDELGAAHGGVAFLAIRNSCPVVPVGIAGTEEALPAGAKLPRFPRVAIVMGEPIDPAQFVGGRKERTEAMTQAIMERIAAARDEARRVRIS
ncbi:MAG: lysophospholipid acyltransferase family protein [Coriobacteriia bacterium]|nr:lysophospholipid acyltransferase family protein [Coriobacteriia bacterium]